MKLLLILGLLFFPCAANAAVDMVPFPNMVKPQAVASVAALPAGEGLALDFVTSAPTDQQVKMPANGEFEVKVQAGPQFAVLDNDATDGLAVVQMPVQVMDIYLRPEGTAGIFHLEDPLYYHHEQLGVLQQQAWYHLPGRPLPVPTDWYSPDGQEYILKLTNQGISVLKTRWKQAQQKMFPVGTKEMGPEGGIVELPGVGEIRFPENAIHNTTTIVMRQEPKVFPKTIMLSPIVRFEPFNLKPAKTVYVRLNINQQLVGQNHPSFAIYRYLDTDNPIDTEDRVLGQLDNWKTLSSPDNIENISFSSWRALNHLTKSFVYLPGHLLDRDFQPISSSNF